MNKILNKKNIPSFILYFVAVLLMIYAAWAFVHSADVISWAKANGQLSVSGNEYDIVNFYMSNCIQYVIYALLLSAAGLILQRKRSVVNDASDITQQPPQNSEADEELDEFFDDAESVDKNQREDGPAFQ